MAGVKVLRVSFWVLLALAAVLAINLALNHPPASQRESASVKLSPTNVRSINLASSPPISRYNVLLNGRLFAGLAAKEDKPAAAKPVNLPKLEGFRLVGLMAGSGDMSFAVVEEASTGRQEMVGVGDTLGPGEVMEILPDRVVVEIEGRRHQLILPETTLEELSDVLTLKRDQLSRAGFPAVSSNSGPRAETVRAPASGPPVRILGPARSIASARPAGLDQAAGQSVSP